MAPRKEPYSAISMVPFGSTALQITDALHKGNHQLLAKELTNVATSCWRATAFAQT
jgi:hypothetical protein